MEKNEFIKGAIFSFTESIQYNTGAIVSKTILKNSKGNISLFAFDKGEALSEHTAAFDALIQILDGEGEIIINKNSHFLKTGQSIIMPANIPHAVKATTAFKMLLTMVKDSE